MSKLLKWCMLKLLSMYIWLNWDFHFMQFLKENQPNMTSIQGGK